MLASIRFLMLCTLSGMASRNNNDSYSARFTYIRTYKLADLRNCEYMQYLRKSDARGSRLFAVDSGDVYDLTSADNELDSFENLVRAARVAKKTVDDIAAQQFENADVVDRPDDVHLSTPVVPDEVWAAGVTYEISEEARREESGMPEIYLDVYDADRPEIFFKGTERHVVGPHESIGVRGDSDWNVPEPELGIVLYDGEAVGYTIGNDVSSRSIEGQNPLYLPQAKVYDRSCSIGTAVVSTDRIEDPHNLDMSMRITRDGETMYEESTSTSEMVRSCQELINAYTNYQAVPEFSILLTGTSLVPSDEFTLLPGDRVIIDLQSIGTLENDVVEV